VIDDTGKTGSGRLTAPPTRFATADISRFPPHIGFDGLIGRFRQDPHHRHPSFMAILRIAPKNPIQPQLRFQPDNRGFDLRFSGL
jgi:hypothetical protein